MSKTIKKEFSKATVSGPVPELKLAQISWMVKDMERKKAFFQGMLGTKNFNDTAATRLSEYEGTYYRKSSNAENLITIGYTREIGVFTEIMTITGNGEKADQNKSKP